MCLAIPGKIIKIEEKTVIVDYLSEQREAVILDSSDLSVGDYVYVSNKIVVQKIPKEEALQCIKLFQNAA